jgi:uncharacterized protein YjiS (DUF1127 family)
MMTRYRIHWRNFARTLQERRATRALAQLDDRLLNDMGLDRNSITHVVRHGRPLGD